MADTEVHLLDVGTVSYGDCVVLRLAGDGREVSVLVDGGHQSDKASLIKQFRDIFGHASPFPFDLMIISHAHDDHIGALPELVKEGHLHVGHALLPDSDMAFGPDSGQDAATDSVLQAVALLREEPPDDDAVDLDDLESMALDAAQLRPRYDEMQDNLTQAGTKVVLFGSSGKAALTKLQHAFADVGLKILGPSQPALDRTAALLVGATDAVIDSARSMGLAGQDSVAVLDALDALDAQKRLGHLVNAQSVVCRFAVQTPVGPRKILLGGDFQFARLQSNDATLTAERDRLLEAIAGEAPFGFAKLSHHGSDNAVNPDFLDALGDTDLLGICCGRGHPAHPDPDTLRLLKQRPGTPNWIRTDRSGHLKVTIKDQGVRILPSGATNIAERNEPDAVALPASVAPLAPRTPATPAQPAAPLPGQQESMRFDIPARASSLTIRIDLNPATPASSVSTDVPPQAPARAVAERVVAQPGPAGAISAGPKQFQIGGGRALEPMLFLTDSTRLARYTAPNVVTTIAQAIDSAGHRLCDVAGGASTVEDIAAALRGYINQELPSQVVIIGGYDVIPADQVDVIPPETPDETKDSLRRSDPDSFMVWSDDTYVDIDGVGLPDLPISRVPDAKDSLFLLNALQAMPAAAPARVGIRNTIREFVAPIFDTLPGAAGLLVSGPEESSSLVPDQLRGTYPYYMLHGDHEDAKRFWGEQPRGNLIEAVTLGQLPKDGVDIAVLGCCWGALPADTKAADWKPGDPIAGRTANQSIALSLLSAGARAVIGCTGAHYSPVRPPYESASGPFHKALWRGILTGKPPAVALLDAKYDFVTRVATLTDANEVAIAYKTIGQFTCLGLGC